jgi:hypothetical protein
MVKGKRVSVVEYITVEFDRAELDYMLFFLDKARTQMINDGTGTPDRVAVLNEFEQAMYESSKGRDNGR